MSLLYRAIWNDSRHDLVDLGEQHFLGWVGHKGVDLAELTPGEIRQEITQGRGQFAAPAVADVVVARASIDNHSVSRMRLVERRDDSGETWTTTFVAMEASTAEPGTLWVDIERVSEDPFNPPPFRAPRLVRELVASGLADGGDPRVGHVRLEERPVALRAGPLAGLVRNEGRRLSLAVFSHDDELGYEATMQRAVAAQERLLGVALVLVLPEDEVSDFRERVGEELAVWGGGARLYLPNRGPRGLRPDRHRYVPGFRMRQSITAGGESFVRLLSASVTATPPPAGWDVYRRALASGGADDESGILEYALAETAALEAEVAVLRAALAERDDEIDNLTLDNAELEIELNQMSASFATVATASSGASSPGGHELPPQVDSVAEALELASQLAGIVLHADAPRDIEQLDGCVSATSWANGLWRGFRALDAYGANDEGINGGFWEWCSRTSSPWKWPATSKKLAMTESESVLSNRKMREQRMLPIATEVDPAGLVLMTSHLKIAEGGGPLAPRVYFYDDSDGPTGKVHVGFVGPHSYMSNTRTN